MFLCFLCLFLCFLLCLVLCFLGGGVVVFGFFLLGFFIGIVFTVVVAKSAYIDERDAGQCWYKKLFLPLGLMSEFFHF